MRTLWDGERFDAAFDRLATNQDAAALDLDQLRALERICPSIDAWIDHAEKRVDPRGANTLQAQQLDMIVQEARRLLKDLRPRLTAAKSDDDLLREFVDEHALRSVFDRLVAFDTSATAALTPAKQLPLSRPTPDLILRDVEFLSHQLLARLARGPARRHVLERLRSYLEHFAFDDVMLKLAAEEKRAGTTGKAQRERILQDEIDRFVFLEGLFPITHAEAGRGELDTLLDLYKTADAQRQIPLLIELKQELNVRNPKKVTESGVRAAVADARRQAEHYRKHISAHTLWKDVEPVVVIAHNCGTRLDIEADDVFAIYLGTDTPSRRRGRSSPGRRGK